MTETPVQQTKVADRHIAITMMMKAVRIMTMKDEANSETMAVVSANYKALPQETKDYLNEMFSHDFVHDTDVILIFTKMVLNKVDPVMIEDVAFYCYNASTRHLNEEIVSNFKWTSEQYVQYRPIRTDITGMGYYHKLDSTYAYVPGVALRKQSDLAQKQCAALFSLHEYAYFLDEYFLEEARFIRVTTNNTIEPHQIAQLVVDRPDHVQEIIKVMDSRHSADVELITSIIDSDTKALSEGIL